MTFLKRAIADGYARITGEGKSQKITYVAAQHSERFSDPDETTLRRTVARHGAAMILLAKEAQLAP